MKKQTVEIITEVQDMIAKDNEVGLDSDSKKHRILAEAEGRAVDLCILEEEKRRSEAYRAELAALKSCAINCALEVIALHGNCDGDLCRCDPSAYAAAECILEATKDGRMDMTQKYEIYRDCEMGLEVDETDNGYWAKALDVAKLETELTATKAELEATKAELAELKKDAIKTAKTALKIERGILFITDDEYDVIKRILEAKKQVE